MNDAQEIITRTTQSAGDETPVIGKIHRPITEDWLRDHEFRLLDGFNDERLPVRRLSLAWDGVDGKQFFEAPDDLCIDVALATRMESAEWHTWVARAEPYEFLHVRKVKYTWELAALYSGLTGRIWPGVL